MIKLILILSVSPNGQAYLDSISISWRSSLSLECKYPDDQAYLDSNSNCISWWSRQGNLYSTSISWGVGVEVYCNDYFLLGVCGCCEFGAALWWLADRKLCARGQPVYWKISYASYFDLRRGCFIFVACALWLFHCYQPCLTLWERKKNQQFLGIFLTRHPWRCQGGGYIGIKLSVCPCVTHLSWRYLLNHYTVCSQTWYDGGSSWPGVSCEKVGFLSSR